MPPCLCGEGTARWLFESFTHLSPSSFGTARGVSGLACAHRLLELSKEKNLPLEVDVLDAGGKAGGTLSTVEENGFLMEEGPDCFITEKPAALELCGKLGLEGQLIKTNPDALKQSFILKGTRLLHPIPEALLSTGAPPGLAAY